MRIRTWNGVWEDMRIRHSHFSLNDDCCMSSSVFKGRGCKFDGS